jgi:hypothetical protein
VSNKHWIKGMRRRALRRAQTVAQASAVKALVEPKVKGPKRVRGAGKTTKRRTAMR